MALKNVATTDTLMSKSKRPIIVYEKMLNFDGCGLEPFFKEAQDLEL